MNRLMNRESGDSAFDDNHIATAEDLSAFDVTSSTRCCTAQTFRVELTARGERTVWNKSAAKVFVDNFRLHYPNHAVKAVEQAFFTYLRSVKRQFKSCSTDPSELFRQQTKRTRYQRKSNVRSGVELALPMLTLGSS